MAKISINLNQFQNIVFEDCLNYYPYPKIEKIVESNTKSIVKSLKSKKYKNLSDFEKLKLFLEKLLLKVSVHQNWIESRDAYELDQQYLYIVIKRHLYIEYPELLN